MKKILLLTLLLGGLSAYAQTAPPAGPLVDPQVVSLGSDAPRFPLLPYNNAETAMAGIPQGSSYIQWLNGSWKFRSFASAQAVDTLLTAVEASTAGWETVAIPSRQASQGAATLYRTEFKVPFAWIGREVFVHVGPVSRAYYLYINGRQAGYFEESKSAAEFNITRLVAEGKNHLSVIAYSEPASTELENQLPGRGTAIEGDVYVFTQPRVRMRDYVADMRIAKDGSSGLFNLGVVVKTHLLNTREVTLHYDLFAPDSTKVSSGRRDARFDMRGEDTVRFFANIPNVDSWSHESPKLYTVLLRLQHEGRFTEYTTIRLGFREVAYDRSGLLINGRRIDLRAVDYTPPQDEAALKRDMEAFRAAGVNLLHVANHPQQRSFYAMCDRYGLYVCDQANLDTRLSGEELRVGGTLANDTLWARAYADRVMEMYYASKNHPSVVMFSLGGRAGRGYNMYEAYLQLKQVEKDRPVIYAGAGSEWNTDMVVGSQTGRNPSDTRYVIDFSDLPRWKANPAASPRATLSESDRPDVAILRNGYSIANLTNFRVGYTILSGKKTIKEAVLPVALPPGEASEVRASLEGLKPGKYTLCFYVCHKDDGPLGRRGERLSEVSWEVAIAKERKK